MKYISVKKIGLTTLAVLLTGGALWAQNLKIAHSKWTGPIVPYRAPDSPNAPPFFSNLVVDPFTGCNYNFTVGYYEWGPNNCVNPGSSQWVAVPFFAGHTGVPARLQAAVVLDPACTGTSTNKVILALYDDDGSVVPSIPRNLLGQARAIAPAGPCAVATANLRNGPLLAVGVKYWLVATTDPTTSGMTFSGIWYAANGAAVGYSVDSGGTWNSSGDLIPAGAVL